jgi:hypothetical protein
MEIARVLKRPGQLIHINGFSDTPPQFNTIVDEWRRLRKSGSISRFERSATGELFLPEDWYKIEEHRSTYPTTENPKRFLEAVKNRWWSNMWEMDDFELNMIYEVLEQTTQEQFGEDYDVEIEATSGIVLQVFLPKR